MNCRVLERIRENEAKIKDANIGNETAEQTDGGHKKPTAEKQVGANNTEEASTSSDIKSVKNNTNGNIQDNQNQEQGKKDKDVQTMTEKLRKQKKKKKKKSKVPKLKSKILFKPPLEQAARKKKKDSKLQSNEEGKSLSKSDGCRKDNTSINQVNPGLESGHSDSNIVDSSHEENKQVTNSKANEENNSHIPLIQQEQLHDTNSLNQALDGSKINGNIETRRDAEMSIETRVMNQDAINLVVDLFGEQLADQPSSQPNKYQ